MQVLFSLSPLAPFIFLWKRKNTAILCDSQLNINHINNLSVNHKYVSEMSMQWQKDGHQSPQTEQVLIATTN